MFLGSQKHVPPAYAARIVDTIKTKVKEFTPFPI